MKKFVKEFILRGLLCASGGPLVLAIVYGMIDATENAVILSPREVCIGIITITLMAFVASGITTIYHVERLPLICAVLIHGGVLYLDYLFVYLANSWIPRNRTAIGIFTAVFFAAYVVIWICIYLCIKAKTDRINRKLHK